MTQAKSERLLNLTFCLLATRRFMTRGQIRGVVQGYFDLSDDTFERTFERDKAELRSLGVPLETGSSEYGAEAEDAYRIPRGDFELPPVEFTAEEAMVLGVAARVWEQETLADQATSALSKLRAAGLEPDTSRLSALRPSLTAREPAFETLFDATVDRTAVTFAYRGQQRRVEPWRMVSRRGNWYVLGRDVDKGEPRMFKLARLDGAPRLAGKPGAFERPEAARLEALVKQLEPGEPLTTSVVAIRGEQAPALRRRGHRVETVAPLPGYECYEVGYARMTDLAAEICGHGADVLVVAPDDVRAEVLRRLTAVAGDAA